jgi:tRNA-dihydrouridine synthase
MVAVSHRALRELILEFGGLDLAFTEMASAAAAVSGSPYEEWYLDAGPEPGRCAYQFYTVKPERLVEALAFVAERPVFGADINFGCSAPQIKRAGGGVAWMRRPEAAAELVAAARGVWKKPLSAKIRLGDTEDYPALLAFCKGLEASGLDFITLHPRLGDEKFRRQSRWEYVARLAADLSIPVVGNGDIHSFQDWDAKRSEARPAGCMLGRAAVQRPWIFALIKGRAANADFRLEVDLEATAYRFLDLVEARLPGDFHLTRARRFFFYYSDNFSYAHHLKWKLENAPDLGAMRGILAEYFSEVPADKRRIESN